MTTTQTVILLVELGIIALGAAFRIFGRPG
jgi:hypothetical protein